MKKLMICTGLAAVALAVPAQAHKPDGAGKPEGAGKSEEAGKSRGAEKSKGKGGRCTPRKVGYNARGMLVSVGLTQTKGADTPDDAGDDRYSGTVEVDVKKANHRGQKGVQTFTLTDARVKFSDADGDGTVEAPQAGDLVKVHGKVTRLNKRCDSSGFTSAVTVKKVQFKAPEAPEPPQV